MAVAVEDRYSESQERVIRAYRALAEERGWNLRDAARPVQIAGSTLSQIFSRQYNGDVGKICARMSKMLHRERERARAPRAPGFKLTSVAADVLGALADAHTLRKAVLVTGPSGTGRTFSIAEYSRREGDTTVVITAAPGARAKSMLVQIAEALDIDAAGSAYTLIGRIADELRGSDRLLVIDEIDYVSEGVLHTLRTLADRSGCGIAYVGTGGFLERLRRRRTSTIEQFLNRLTYHTICGSLLHEDMDLLMEDVKIDPDARQLAREACAGCARRLVNGLILAQRMTAGNGITPRIIQKAFKKLLAI